MSIQPIKNLDEATPETLSRISAASETFNSPSICGFNPFIYGNDVDSVDVATRIAVVSVALFLSLTFIISEEGKQQEFSGNASAFSYSKGLLIT